MSDRRYCFFMLMVVAAILIGLILLMLGADVKEDESKWLGYPGDTNCIPALTTEPGGSK